MGEQLCDSRLLAGTKMVYLKAAEMWIGNKPAVIKTVLGSCVSVTFFHPGSGLASICHAIQPRCPRKEKCSQACVHRYRYADCAIDSIIRQMQRKGMKKSDIEVKLFGGAVMIKGKRSVSDALSVGELNAQVALETIHRSKLRLKAVNTGGGVGRKLIFDAANGEVLMRRLKNSAWTG